jgi:hypothetical protein
MEALPEGVCRALRHVRDRRLENALAEYLSRHSASFRDGALPSVVLTDALLEAGWTHDEALAIFNDMLSMKEFVVDALWPSPDSPLKLGQRVCTLHGQTFGPLDGCTECADYVTEQDED